MTQKKKKKREKEILTVCKLHKKCWTQNNLFQLGLSLINCYYVNLYFILFINVFIFYLFINEINLEIIFTKYHIYIGVVLELSLRIGYHLKS